MRKAEIELDLYDEIFLPLIKIKVKWRPHSSILMNSDESEKTFQFAEVKNMSLKVYLVKKSVGEKKKSQNAQKSPNIRRIITHLTA